MCEHLQASEHNEVSFLNDWYLKRYSNVGGWPNNIYVLIKLASVWETVFFCSAKIIMKTNNTVPESKLPEESKVLSKMPSGLFQPKRTFLWSHWMYYLEQNVAQNDVE